MSQGLIALLLCQYRLPLEPVRQLIIAAAYHQYGVGAPANRRQYRVSNLQHPKGPGSGGHTFIVGASDPSQQ